MNQFLYYKWQGLHQLTGGLVDGTPVWERDWDVLCILDACRVDTFREYHPDAESYWSVGSTSQTWLSRTFDAPPYESVGYVSGNPYASELDPDNFGYFHIEPVGEADGGVETVAPETLRDRAATVWRNRGEVGVDKLIIHFMQPHVPFRSRPEWFTEFEGTDTWGSSVWKRLRTGEISKAEFFDAYRDNLDWVLEGGVYPLRDLVDATIGVTADHGNAAGEWGLYGHPEGVLAPSVRNVPWETFDGTDTGREIEDVDLSEGTLTDEETRTQLEALGYVSE